MDLTINTWGKFYPSHFPLLLGTQPDTFQGMLLCRLVHGVSEREGNPSIEANEL